MTRSAIIKRSGWLFLFVVILAACRAEEDGDQPVPTRFDADAMSTQLALQTTITAPPPTAEPATETPGITPTDTAPATAPPSEVPTGTPSPTETPSLAPTGLSDADQQSTWIAQTNTAIAAVQPFTQTVSAIRDATGTALAQVSATPTPTMTGTPEAEPFQVVFYTNRNGNDDIYLLTLNGEERAVTRTATNEREPSCSPDGRSVVFASDASGSYQIYLLPLNSTTPVQLTDSAGLNFAPTFSPDGSQIAFVSTRQDGIPIIWVMNADGSNPQPVTTELGRDTSPSWGPDGRQLLFSSDQFGPWDLFLTILEEEVEGEFPIMPPELSQGNQLWPVFDSLGERIAYTTFENLENPQTSNIYILDFEQPEPLPIRVGPGADIAWAWGDDTHLLASVGGPDDVQIALVDITTREAVRLTDAGTFNGGARLCTVQPGILPPEPTPAPSPTPTLTPTIAPTTEPTVTPTETPVPTPTLSVLSPELMAAQGHRHVIQPGDTLMGLGYRYGVNWQDLAVINALPDPDRLSVGVALTIPVIHTAQRISGFQNPQLDAEVSLFVRKEIVVELSKQIVTAYENGRLIKTVTVSTGLPATPTVQGEFSIYVKRPSQTMSGPGYFLPDVPYVMYFYQGYGLHGTYWHDNFGQPMSHGCVNLPTTDARWLYDWAEVGTPVLVKN